MNTTEFDTVFAKPLKRSIRVALFGEDADPNAVIAGRVEPYAYRSLKAKHKVEHSNYFGTKMYHIVEVNDIGARNKYFASQYWNESIEVVKELDNDRLVRFNNSYHRDESFLCFIPKA